MAEAYRSQNTTLLEQVFTAKSFSDVLTDTSAYLSYGDQDAQLAAEIVEDQQALDQMAGAVRDLSGEDMQRVKDMLAELNEMWDERRAPWRLWD